MPVKSQQTAGVSSLSLALLKAAMNNIACDIQTRFLPVSYNPMDFLGTKPEKFVSDNSEEIYGRGK